MTDDANNAERIKAANLFGAVVNDDRTIISITIAHYLALAKAFERRGRDQASLVAQRQAHEYREAGMIHQACALDVLAGMLNRVNEAHDAEVAPVLQYVRDAKLYMRPAEGNA